MTITLDQLTATTCEITLWVVAFDDGVETGIGTRAELLALVADDVFGVPVVFRKA